jgi:hypothetical protein
MLFCANLGGIYHVLEYSYKTVETPTRFILQSADAFRTSLSGLESWLGAE